VEKIDFKRAQRHLYAPPTKPAEVEVPNMRFLMIEGVGAPESECYQQAIGALYSLAWTIKMSKMGGNCPPDYTEYVMPPLEGLWEPGEQGLWGARESWRWTSMLRQPEFVTPEVLLRAKQELARKKGCICRTTKRACACKFCTLAPTAKKRPACKSCARTLPKTVFPTAPCKGAFTTKFM